MKILRNIVLFFIIVSCNSVRRTEFSFRGISNIKLYNIDLKKCNESKSISLFNLKDSMSCFRFYKEIKKQDVLILSDLISKKEFYSKGIGYTFDTKFALLLESKNNIETIDFDGFGQVKISSKKSKKIYLLTPKGKKVYDSIFKDSLIIRPTLRDVP